MVYVDGNSGCIARSMERGQLVTRVTNDAGRRDGGAGRVGGRKRGVEKGEAGESRGFAKLDRGGKKTLIAFLHTAEYIYTTHPLKSYCSAAHTP